MIHKNRRICMLRYPSVAEAAQRILGSVWTLCTGMRATFEGYEVLFIHDGGGEFAVVFEIEGKLVQVESYTINWMKTPERVIAELRRTIALFDKGEPPMRSEITDVVLDDLTHRCPDCA